MSFTSAAKQSPKCFGRVQVINILAIGLILMTVLNETMGITFINPAAQCDLSLSATDKGVLSSICFIGIIVSGHFWGYIADTRGRRLVLIFTTLTVCAISTASCFANSFWVLLGLRFLAGLFISCPSSTLYAYLGEFNGPKTRSTAIALASSFIGISSIYSPLVAYFVLPAQWSYPLYEGLNFRPWRLLWFLYTLPGLLGVLVLAFLKESPKFLISQGRNEECLKVLKWIYSKNTGKSNSNFPVSFIKSELNQEHQNSLKTTGPFAVVLSMWHQTVPLLKRPYVINFMNLCFLQCCVFMISAGVTLWYGEILNRITADADGSQTMCQILMPQITYDSIHNETVILNFKECDDWVMPDALLRASILGIFTFFGFLMISFFVKGIGRGTIILVCFLLSGISGIIIQFVTDPIAITILFLSSVMFAGLNIPVINSIAVDLFPTHLRAMSVCIILICGRAGTVIGTNLVGSFLANYCVLTYGIFTGFFFVCAGLSLFLPRK